MSAHFSFETLWLLIGVTVSYAVGYGLAYAHWHKPKHRLWASDGWRDFSVSCSCNLWFDHDSHGGRFTQ